MGYQPVGVPPVGFTTTYTTGHHAAGDKLFRFPDRRGRDLAFVSDSLPAVLRLAHARGLPEQRLSYCCPIFRYERRPRRHYHLLGLIEVNHRPAVPSQRARATARLATTVTRFLSARLPITFTITDPGVWHTIADLVPVPHPAGDLVNSLRQLGPHERPALLHRWGAPADLVRLAEQLAADPTGAASAGTPALALRERITHCLELADTLTSRGAGATVDLGELHASEFHDGPAFLIRPISEQRLLGDGGSYRPFAHAFLGAPAEVYSAVVGLERLTDLVPRPGPRPTADVAVLAQPELACLRQADHLTDALRAAGVAVWDQELTGPLRHHLRDLAHLRVPYSILVGPQEVDSDTYTVRGRDGTLHPVRADEIAKWLRDRTTDAAPR